MALTEVLPYLGPWLGAIPPVIYALVVDPLSALWVTLLFLGIHQIEGHIVVPNVMGNALRLHPLLVIFGLLAGFEVNGLVGRADRAAAARGRARDLGVLRRPARARAVAGRRRDSGRGRARVEASSPCRVEPSASSRSGPPSRSAALTSAYASEP